MTLPKLGYYLRPIATSATIKNTVPAEPTEGHFPGFSASGQDVWVPYFDYNGPAIILSAVGAQCGKTFIANGKWGAVANTTGLAVDRNKSDTGFFWYMTNLPDFWEKGGSAQPYVKVSETLRKRVSIPDLPTQRAIADFLDRETARIDLLIEKKQRLVALLEEKFLEQQRSLFYGNRYQSDSNTYLSRLNPDWAISKNARHFKIRMGETILSDSVSESGRYPVYSATETDIIFGYVEKTNALLKHGDLVIPARGNSIGHVKYMTQPSTSTQTTIQMSLFDETLDSEYVFCWIKAFKQHLFPFDRTAIPQITTEQVGRNPLPLAPNEDQRRIVSEFNRLADQEQMLLAPTIKSIDRLKEYRSALITAAVTGQVDVGEWDMAGTNERRLDALDGRVSA